jgi:hypothetical protein
LCAIPIDPNGLSQAFRLILIPALESTPPAALRPNSDDTPAVFVIVYVIVPLELRVM